MGANREASDLVWVVVLICALVTTVSLAKAKPLKELANGNTQRILRLHSRDGRMGTFLQNNIAQVDGAPQQTLYSALTVREVGTGLVVITHKESGHYLCMNSKGSIHGSLHFRLQDCIFKQKNLGHGLAVFYSPQHHFLMSLWKTPVNVGSNKNVPPSAKFYIRPNGIPEDQFTSTEHGRRKRDAVLDNNDPLGILITPMIRYAERSIPKGGSNPAILPQESAAIPPQDPIRSNPKDTVDSNDPNGLLAIPKHAV